MTATHILIKLSTKGYGWWKEKTDTALLIAFLLTSGLMKECWACIAMTFSMLKSPIHQFIGFSFIIKPAVEATEVSIAIRRLARWTSVLPTDKGKPTPPQAFGNKSHSSLWRFLHAPLTLMLKTPQWASGVAPWTPPFASERSCEQSFELPKVYELF